jgi:hypothetical protein
MLFQYPVVALLAAILTDITQAAGVYCEYESKPYFAKLWVGPIPPNSFDNHTDENRFPLSGPFHSQSPLYRQSGSIWRLKFT